MGFLAPILLLGVLGAAIPIVLHLYFRQRGQRVPFSAMAFLLRSHRREERGIRLKQLLLLALRVGLLLLLPIAMAQPFTRCGQQETAVQGGDRLPTSVVFVVEDSPWMSATGRDEAGWEAAERAIETRARQLRAWDRAAIVLAASRPVLVSELVAERSALLQAWSRTEPRFAGSDLGAALLEAREVHAQGQLSSRRTVIVGAAGEESWREVLGRDPTRWRGLGQIEFVDLDPPEAHVGLGALRVEDAGEVARDAVRVVAPLQAEGVAAGTTVRAHLRVGDEEVDTQEVALDGEGRAAVNFVHTVSGQGVLPVMVHLEGAPGWGAAHRRHSVVERGSGMRLVVVNGDPRSIRFNDELFFLEEALRALERGGVSLNVTTVTVEGLQDGHVDGADVLLLANVGSLPVERVRRIQERVEAGMGLWIAAGDNLDPDAREQRLAPLFPRPIRSRRLLARSDDPDASIRAVRLSNIDRNHPVFRVFSAHGGESLQNVHVYQYILLEPDTSSEVRTLATFSDGAPALVERRMGQGRVLFWTSTLDMDWTDLPLRGAYVPLVHRSLEFLSRGGARGATVLASGERLTLDLESMGVDEVRATDLVRGDRRLLEADGAGDAVFEAERPGVWTLSGWVGESEVPLGDGLVVVEPPRFSIPLAPVDQERRNAWAEEAGEGVWGEQAEVARRHLWPWLLFLVLLVLYGETLVAMRRRAWQRLRELWTRGLGRGERA